MTKDQGRPALPDESADVVDLLRRRAAQQPRRKVFVFLKNGEAEAGRLTFAELDVHARSIAAQLQQHFQPGERVLLAYASVAEFTRALFGALYAGVVAVPVAAPSGSTDIARLAALAQDCGATGLCLGHEGFNLEYLTATGLPLERQLRCVTTSGDDGAHAGDWRAQAPGPAGAALLQYTAGMSGTPKGVLVSHGNLMHNEALIHQAFGHGSRTVGVSWLPAHRGMGLIGALLQPVFAGCTSVLMSPTAFFAKPLRWLQAISRYRASTSGGPGFAYEMCVRRIRAEQAMELDLSSWESAFVGGGVVRPETLERFAEKFAICRFDARAWAPCYGQTEATLMVSCTPKRESPKSAVLDADELQHQAVRPCAPATRRMRELTSCGPVLGMDVVIADPATAQPCAADHVGEVWVRGDSVAQGYWQRPQQTRDTFGARLADGSGPWLRTGDLGFVLDGELFITGTLGDSVVIRGRHYDLRDIEHTVRDSHPALSEGASAAVCVGGGTQPPRVVLMQEVQQDELLRLDRAAVLKAARHSLRVRAGLTLHDIVFVKAGSLPRTTEGQVQRDMAWAACRPAARGRGPVPASVHGGTDG